MEGRFLLHCSDKANWRLRNVQEHPFDPGWEVGTYSRCHDAIRTCTEPGTVIFDVAVKGNRGVIRSAFRVSGVEGEGESRVLLFEEYYFADDEPIELSDDCFIQYRQMTLDKWMKKYGQESPWSRIKREYSKYESGSRPRSVDSESWDHMVRESAKFRNWSSSPGPVSKQGRRKGC